MTQPLDPGKLALYAGKPADYYSNLNEEVVTLLEPAESLLEVGCGAGALGAYARKHRLFRRQYGIELSPTAAELAKAHYDSVVQADLDSSDAESIPTCEAVVCADVLEHLFDPWSTFRMLVGRLTPGGYLVLSIPNARFIRVWGGLVFGGHFDYEESGVRDRGHLRWFALSNLRQLALDNNLVVERVICKQKPKARFLTIVSFGLLSEFLTFQYVLRFRKPKA